MKIVSGGDFSENRKGWIELGGQNLADWKPLSNPGSHGQGLGSDTSGREEESKMSAETNYLPWDCARNVGCTVSIKLKFKDARSLFFRCSQSMQGFYIINSYNLVCHDTLWCEMQEELQETQ